MLFGQDFMAVNLAHAQLRRRIVRAEHLDRMQASMGREHAEKMLSSGITGVTPGKVWRSSSRASTSRLQRSKTHPDYSFFFQRRFLSENCAVWRPHQRKLRFRNVWSKSSKTTGIFPECRILLVEILEVETIITRGCLAPSSAVDYCLP